MPKLRNSASSASQLPFANRSRSAALWNTVDVRTWGEPNRLREARNSTTPGCCRMVATAFLAHSP